MRAWYANLRDRPFASALAILLFASTVTTLAGIGETADALDSLVPEWLLVGLAIAYGAGGFFLMLGLMHRRGNWEATGCVLVGTGLAIRLVAVYSVVGFTVTTVVTGLFYIVFGWACVERFRQILEGDTIIRVHHQMLKENGGGDDAGS